MSRKSRLIQRISFAVVAGLMLTECHKSGFRFNILFEQAHGLKQGAEVRFAGLPVGTVERVSLQPAPTDSTPQALVAVIVTNPNVRVKRDDQFSVETAGLLGEEYIDIVERRRDSPPLSPGETVRGESLPQLKVSDLATYLRMLALGTEIESLPKEKREEVLREIEAKVSAAARTTPAPNKPPVPPPVKR